MSTNLKDNSLLKRVLDGADKLPSKMARSLLPGLADILTKNEIDKLDGSLRRGDISVLQAPFLLDILDRMRTGELNNSHQAFSRLYQFCSLLKKYPEKGSDDVCRKAALLKFEAGEAQCKETNDRFKSEGLPFDSIGESVKDIIYDILGDLKPSFLDTEVKFGPGSTVNPENQPYENTAEFFKLSDKLYVTEELKPYLAAHLSYQQNWMECLRTHYHINDTGRSQLEIEKLVFDKHFIVVPNDFPNRLSFVPKERDEHRTIGVEKNGPVLIQMSIGGSIRQALKKHGLDLNTQERNRHFAKLAITFKNATIDMANASNTMAYQVVKYALPYDWFAACDASRSSHGRCNNPEQSYKYEMFSSMGNGFTFELESLLFYAIALATLRKNGYTMKEAKRSVTVFGDDVIVPQAHALEFISNLSLFGFKTNSKKSFLSGKFFESCGHDYYDGTDVRPFFIKRQIKTVRDAYFVCNSLLFKSIKSKSGFLAPAYVTLLKAIAHLPIQPGPLHFYEGKDGWAEVHDDLEAVLRVPLEYAQTHGGVKFDYNLRAWKYKKWIRLAIEPPLSKSPQYAVQHVRYLTFLRGTVEGKAAIRGRSKDLLKRCSTSSWDGALSRRELTALSEFFQI